jgi:hypothetical protein
MAKPKLKLPGGYEVHFSDDGSLLLCLGGRLALYDILKLERLWSGRQVKYPSHASFSADGLTLAVKNTSGRIVVLDAKSGELIHDHKSQKEGEGCQIHFTPDADELIDGSWKDILTVRDAKRGTVRQIERFPGESTARISHDGTRRCWLIEHNPRATPPERAGTTGRDGYVRFREWPFDLHDERVFRFPFYVLGATLAPGGKVFCFANLLAPTYLYLASSSDGSIVKQSESLEQRPRDMVWSLDGEIIATVQFGKFVFYRASDLSVAAEVLATYPEFIAFRPGTEEVALCAWNQTVLVPFIEILKGNVNLK